MFVEFMMLGFVHCTVRGTDREAQHVACGQIERNDLTFRTINVSDVEKENTR
jgi:hypothetical protein